jgi:DNA-binding transcriptional regulator YhcF (GntR family)
VNRKSNLFVPHVTLDRASSIPLHQQLFQAIAHEIRRAAIPQDARLPSTRSMTKLLRVSRNTVLRAYEELADAGLITGKQGSCMRVSQPSAAPLLPNLRQLIRQSGFPARTLSIEDPDGNPLYINF